MRKGLKFVRRSKALNEAEVGFTLWGSVVHVKPQVKPEVK